MSQRAEDSEATEVLEFWFGPFIDGWVDATHRQRWFATDPSFDEEIAARFTSLLERAKDGNLDHWQRAPHDALALILVCDQFPRNIYRNDPKAFSWDAQAKETACHLIRQRMHHELTFEERSFAYMPFEHSEDILDQYLSVALFTELRDLTPKGKKDLTGATLRYAQRHFDVVARFGRFPHRNAALNRVSSSAEAAYLAEGGGF